MKTVAQKNSFISRGRNVAKIFAELQAFDDEYDATSAGTESQILTLPGGLTRGC